MTEEDSIVDHLYVKTAMPARTPDCITRCTHRDGLKMHQCPLLCARCTCSLHKDESKHPFLPGIYSAKLSDDDSHKYLGLITTIKAVSVCKIKKMGLDRGEFLHWPDRLKYAIIHIPVQRVLVLQQ